MIDPPESPRFVVDAHTHVFPPEVVEHRDRWRARDGWFSLLYENPRARLATIEDLIASMDRTGISRSVICGFAWKDPGLCDEHNAYMREAVDRYPDRLSWLAIVSPSHGQGLIERTVDLLDAGSSGLGELNADAQGFELDKIGNLGAALIICEEQARPVLFHASEPVGHDYPGKGTATPDKLLSLVKAFPQLPMVLAHWGGGLPFYELMPEIRAALANVCYDSGASTYLYDFSVFRSVIDIAGAHKAIFGSDYSVLRQDRFFARASSLSWPDPDEKHAVFAGNACRIYGIPISGEARA